MKLTTRYSVGDVVYRKVREYRDYQDVPCDLCSSTGRVLIHNGSGRDFECPDCLGLGTVSVEIPTPGHAEALTIGQVQVVTQGRTDRAAKEITYMCKETGVGSGTLHREENLFPSAEEALNENAD